MNLSRLPHQPSTLVEFYQEALESLGAVCERTWHDRLHLVAEGQAARLWNSDGAFHETELCFPAPDNSAPRDALLEVFPGCPLTFRLAESLRPSPVSLERAVLACDMAARPPAAAVAEKLWHAQMGGSARWQRAAPFRAAQAFSLLSLIRCEIQAIDQHWSLHRIAISLADGQTDEELAAGFDFAQLDTSAPAVEWPAPAPDRIAGWLHAAVEGAMAGELASVRLRQENYLRRELDRIDNYFAGYERELNARAARSKEGGKIKAADRLAAAKAEHARRREDQVKRHEIRVIPHVDTLLLLAEPAWRTTVSVQQHNVTRAVEACFIPRARRWLVEALRGLEVEISRT